MAFFSTAKTNFSAARLAFFSTAISEFNADKFKSLEPSTPNLVAYWQFENPLSFSTTRAIATNYLFPAAREYVWADDAQPGGKRCNPGQDVVTLKPSRQATRPAALFTPRNGTSPGLLHDQIQIRGADFTADLGRVNLLVSLGYTPSIGDTFTVVRLVDSTAKLVGTFDDAFGTNILDNTTFVAGGYRFRVNYRADADGDLAKSDVIFTVVDQAFDFGSAPDSYHTKAADDGPRHGLASGLELGFDVGAELDASNSDVNDGVVLSSMRVGQKDAIAKAFVVNAPAMGTTQRIVSLSGISAGGSETQEVELTAFSYGPTLITDIVVDRSGNSSAANLKLKFAPMASGSETVTVRLRDAGIDGQLNTSDDAVFETQFLVTLNNAPKLDALNNLRVLPTAGQQSVTLRGIGDGDDSSQLLRVTATSSVPSVVGVPTVGYDEINRPTTGDLMFTPLALGSSTITVTVQDAVWDGLFGADDDRSLVRSFNVEVTTFVHPWQNPVDALNVDAQGGVGIVDVLILINAINRGEGGDLSSRVRTNESYYDVNGDDLLTPLDVLVVINAINRAGDGEEYKARQAELEIGQAVAAIGRASPQDSQSGQVWSDLNWLWQEPHEVYGPKKESVR